MPNNLSNPSAPLRRKDEDTTTDDEDYDTLVDDVGAFLK